MGLDWLLAYAGSSEAIGQERKGCFSAFRETWLFFAYVMFKELIMGLSSMKRL